jgi:hypothetical protein
MTLLLFSRTLRVGQKLIHQGKLEPDISSITDKSEMRNHIPSSFIKEFVRRFNLNCEKPQFSSEDFYLSTKAGPHGPATKTARKSLLLYSYDELQALFNITDQNGIDILCKHYKDCFERWELPSMKDPRLNSFKGKLSKIYDPECKVRVIAIVDYYTQLFLKPINDKLFYLIKRFPTDRTFTQNPYHSWSDNEHSFWSLDLSSATDRFPIVLQRRLLGAIFRDAKFAQS